MQCVGRLAPGRLTKLPFIRASFTVLGKLGPGQLGPGQLGPGQLGPGAQFATFWGRTVGPQTIGPRAHLVFAMIFLMICGYFL